MQKSVYNRPANRLQKKLINFFFEEARRLTEFTVYLIHIGPSHASVNAIGATSPNATPACPTRFRWPAYAITGLCSAMRQLGGLLGWGGKPRQVRVASQGALRGPLRVPRGAKCRYGCLCTRMYGACVPGAAVWAPKWPPPTACNPPCKLARGLQSPCSEAQTRMIDVSRA
jgi:hypothetical protein